MKRRDSLKTMALASLGASIFLESCYGISRETITRSLTRYEYGRTPEERKKLMINFLLKNSSQMMSY